MVERERINKILYNKKNLFFYIFNNLKNTFINYNFFI